MMNWMNLGLEWRQPQWQQETSLPFTQASPSSTTRLSLTLTKWKPNPVWTTHTNPKNQSLMWKNTVQFIHFRMGQPSCSVDCIHDCTRSLLRHRFKKSFRRQFQMLTAITFTMDWLSVWMVLLLKKNGIGFPTKAANYSPSTQKYWSWKKTIHPESWLPSGLTKTRHTKSMTQPQIVTQNQKVKNVWKNLTKKNWINWSHKDTDFRIQWIQLATCMRLKSSQPLCCIQMSLMVRIHLKPHWIMCMFTKMVANMVRIRLNIAMMEIAITVATR